MLKSVIKLSLFLSLLGCAGCATVEKREENPVATPLVPAIEAEVNYARGFFELERGPDGSTWRWMGEEGVIRLKNTRREMRLRITGRAPVEQFPQPPTIKLYFNGELLDEIVATPQVIEKEYLISAARQGSSSWSELRLSTNKTFVPKEIDKNATDSRRLGFSLHGLAWDPKSTTTGGGSGLSL